MLIPPNTALYGNLWMHGTRVDCLPAIAKYGLLPRALLMPKVQTEEGLAHLTAQGNWETHPSCESAVYLTSAYGLYFANACADNALRAVLEVNIDHLDPSLLHGDEDSYALSRVQGLEHLQGLSVEARVQYWRTRIEDTDAEVSAEVLGNCVFLGVIPARDIVSVRLVTPREAGQLMLAVHDPIISPSNFRFLGGAHQGFHHWLFDKPLPPAFSELQLTLDRLPPLSYPLMTLSEAISAVCDKTE